MNGHTAKGGTGIATRRLVTGAQAYGSRLSRRTGSMWLSWISYIRLQRLRSASHTYMHHAFTFGFVASSSESVFVVLFCQRPHCSHCWKYVQTYTCGPLLFNICPEPFSLSAVLSSYVESSFCVPHLQGFPMGMGLSDHVSLPNNVQGIYCPLLGCVIHCSVSACRTKWLRIDCSNLFIPRLGGSVSLPKITLKSDYIKFLTPATNNFPLGFQTVSERVCAHTCDVRVCSSVLEKCVCFDYVYVCTHFRGRSCKPAWNYRLTF